MGSVEPVDDFSDSGLAGQGFALFWLGSDHIVFAAEYDTSKGKMSKGGTGRWT